MDVLESKTDREVEEAFHDDREERGSRSRENIVRLVSALDEKSGV